MAIHALTWINPYGCATHTPGLPYLAIPLHFTYALPCVPADLGGTSAPSCPIPNNHLHAPQVLSTQSPAFTYALPCVPADLGGTSAPSCPIPNNHLHAPQVLSSSQSPAFTYALPCVPRWHRLALSPTTIYMHHRC